MMKTVTLTWIELILIEIDVNLLPAVLVFFA
jgi:hypothetical protein